MQGKLTFKLDDAIYVNSFDVKKGLTLLSTRLEKNGYFGVTYTPTDSQLKKIASDEQTKSKALIHCDGFKNPAQCNKEAIELGADYLADKNIGNVFKLVRQDFGLRADIHLQCQFPFGYAENDKIVFFVPHYRTHSWSLSPQGLFLQASVISAAFGRDDFAGATIEMVDMSNKIDGQRVLAAKRYEPSQLIPEKLIYKEFQRFIDICDVYNSRDNSPLLDDQTIRSK